MVGSVEGYGGLAEKKFSDSEIAMAVRVLKALTEAVGPDSFDVPAMDDLIASLKEARTNFDYNTDKILAGLTS